MASPSQSDRTAAAAAPPAQPPTAVAPLPPWPEQLSPYDDQALYDIYIGSRYSVALALAASRGLFGRLAAGPMTVSEVSQAYSWSERGASALLRVLCAKDLLERSAETQQYALTDVSRAYLVPDAPEYFGGLVELEMDHFLTPSMLEDAMRSDRPQAYGGQDVWAVHETDAGRTERFTRAMHSISVRPAIAAATALAPVLGTAAHIIDIGGGSGVFVVAMLRAYTQLCATVFETPAVCPLAARYLAHYGVADRAGAVAGDFFSGPLRIAVPSAAGDTVRPDVCFLSQILHDWTPKQGAQILEQCVAALAPRGWIVVHEKLMDADERTPARVVATNLDILMWTEGQQYTAAGVTRLLVAAGCSPDTMRTVPTLGPWSVVYGQLA